MVVLRIVGQVLIAVALMLLGADAIASLKADDVVVTPLNEFIGLIGLGSPLEGARAGLEQGEVAKFFSRGAVFLLELASWVTFGLIGIVLAWAGEVKVRA